MKIKQFVKKSIFLTKTAKYLLKLPTLIIVIYIRYKIIKKVGLSTYKDARNKMVISFPNVLSHSIGIFHGGYALEKILLVCGIKSSQHNPFISSDIIINWQDLTENFLNVEDYISRSYAYTGQEFIRSVNFKCTDISKKKIASVHKEAFGYDLDVNPLQYKGLVVKKSDSNATHDGVVIECPIKKIDSGFVYNLLICNENGSQAIDYRVIYINGIVDLFYEKRRNLSHRFSNKNDLTILRKIRDEFTKDEISKIEKFALLMGADYGEFDVLRDKNTKKIYIVDLAKTPAGPPNGLSKKDIIKAIEHMAIHFIKKILTV